MKIMQTDEVMETIKGWMEARCGSLIRLGDSELNCIYQDDFKRNFIKPYSFYTDKVCGTKLPDVHMRLKLLQAMKDAKMVGLITDVNNSWRRKYTNLTRRLMDMIYTPFCCSASVNVELAKKRNFWDMLLGKRVLLYTGVENQFKYRRILQKLGAKEVRGISDIPGKLNFYDLAVQCVDFLGHCKVEVFEENDILLCCYGLRAKIAAAQYGKYITAIDFGSGFRHIPKELLRSA